jgi:hypothetical protein
MLAQQQQTAPPIWHQLLPPNHTISDMLDSRSKQQEWYTYLIEHAGTDVANR